MASFDNFLWELLLICMSLEVKQSNFTTYRSKRYSVGGIILQGRESKIWMIYRLCCFISVITPECSWLSTSHHKILSFRLKKLSKDFGNRIIWNVKDAFLVWFEQYHFNTDPLVWKHRNRMFSFTFLISSLLTEKELTPRWFTIQK